MYVQGVDNVYDLNFNARRVRSASPMATSSFRRSRSSPASISNTANTEALLQHFIDAENECKALLAAGKKDGRHELALPAYDQCIKASHTFNLLDARGVISVTERQAYILRVRELAKGCCEAWSKTAGGGATA